MKVTRASLKLLSERLHRAQDAQLLSQNRPIADILPLVRSMQRLGLNQSLFFLRQHWPHIAGEALARHSTPASLKDGILKVQVESPLYRQELTYAAPRILRIAQDHLGAELVSSVRASR